LVNFLLFILKQRRLNEPELVILDVYAGLILAIRKSFLDAPWQRCQVHSM